MIVKQIGKCQRSSWSVLKKWSLPGSLRKIRNSRRGGALGTLARRTGQKEDPLRIPQGMRREGAARTGPGQQMRGGKARKEAGERRPGFT